MVADAQATPTRIGGDAKRLRRVITPTRSPTRSSGRSRSLGDRVPANDKARAEQLISEIRELVKDQLFRHCAVAPTHERPAAESPPPVVCGLQQGDSAGASRRNRRRSGGSDDVIDAEFKKTR